MSVQELKQRIAQLSPTEQADVRQYIDMLQSNETVLDPLPDQVWTEIEKRSSAIDDGTMKTSSTLDVVTQLRERIGK